MVSNRVIDFIVLNIYILLAGIVLIVSFIYISILVNFIKKNRYDKTYNLLKTDVMKFIKKDSKLEKMQQVLTDKYKKNIAIDIMLHYSKRNNVNISCKFEKAGFHLILIEKMKKKNSLKLIKDIAQMQSVETYDILKSATTSSDFEIKYMSFYALSKLELNEIQLKEMTSLLIKSEIMRDRIIEIVFNLNLTFNQYMNLLYEQETELGKLVFMRVVQEKQEIQQEQNSDRIIRFLEDSKEVKISAISLLSRSKNEKYIDIFVELFQTEKEWEVRSEIAKGLRNIKGKRTIEALKDMVYDSAWWVKFNAIESLIYMGIDGVNLLIDLSLDSENKKISDLAYYFLNANKEVYNTIRKI